MKICMLRLYADINLNVIEVENIAFELCSNCLCISRISSWRDSNTGYYLYRVSDISVYRLNWIKERIRLKQINTHITPHRKYHVTR